MCSVIKPDYCLYKELECEQCPFYWPQEKMCSLMPDEEVTDAVLKKKRTIIKGGLS